MTSENKYYTIAALVKAFNVIDLMAHKACWELWEIAEAAKMPKGILQRILLTLCELGYVTQESRGGTYSLTLKFFKLGQGIAANNSLVEQGRATCRQLMESINETVNLCVALNMDMLVVDQQVSWQMLRLDSIIGSSFPIFTSASGKVHCAFLSELELLRFLNTLRSERPSLSPQDIDKFCTELKVVRREGIAFDYEEVFAGVRCVAAPIFDYMGNIAAAIGCSVTVRRTEESSAQLICKVSTAAAKISKTLGAPPRNFVPTTRTMLHSSPAASNAVHNAG
jgi:DNA-binding IclR family transcriptional regulator